MSIKCADLTALAAARPVHCEWVERLEEEFSLQGDKERAAGLPISPLMDRTKEGVTNSQPGVRLKWLEHQYLRVSLTIGHILPARLNSPSSPPLSSSPL